MQKLLFLLIFIMSLPVLHAQQKPLTCKSRSEIVGNISQLLLDNYVFPDVAVKMSDHLKASLKEGKYDKIKDPVLFSDALTSDLHHIYHDGHLLVQFAPNQPTDAESVAAEDPFRRIREANFGLQKAEVLSGNIGYLKIDHFWADGVYGKETLKAALQFISNTNALIIDVRDCGGGSQETVNLICGYFLEESTHINDMFDRSRNTTTEYWTTPDTLFPTLPKMPLYILTNNKTFSAAEEFCYDLQCIKRATIVGETTGGGAHGTFSQSAGNGFVLYIPYSTAVNPVTKTSWEQVGVVPEINVPSDKALETAEMEIMAKIIAQTTDPSELFQLNWSMDLLKAVNNPVVLDEATLREYAGVYGERTFTFENGKLYYQRTGRPKFELEAMSEIRMKAKGNNYFKIDFVRNEAGKVNEVIVYYEDNRVEKSSRNP